VEQAPELEINQQGEFPEWLWKVIVLLSRKGSKRYSLARQAKMESGKPDGYGTLDL
jgi:hypothetical protein